MWRDPLDELIDDLERAVPPERVTADAAWCPLAEVQYWVHRILRREDSKLMDPSAPDDSAAEREEAENMGRAMERFLRQPSGPSRRS